MIKNIGYEFYYNMMSVEEQWIYRTLYEGFMHYEDSFNVYKCDTGQLAKIYEKVLLDHPELFYIREIVIETKCLIEGYLIRPTYKFSQNEVKDINGAVYGQIRDILIQCNGKTEQEKELIIHDFIIRNVTYKDAEDTNSHEMLGVFLYGIGVCEGISKAFKYLCDLVGLKTGIVVGKTKGEAVAHAWNMIMLEGNWYNIDVTFNANLSTKAGEIRYDYYNVADAELTDRCTYEVVPTCNTFYGYYKKVNMYAANQSVLRRLIKNRKRQLISVQLPRIVCSKQQLENYIFQAVNDSVIGYGNVEISICSNHDMNVFTIKIEKVRR